ncbi:MAG: hypothetical protein PHH70_00755 [Candidatus Gracilibacteria bacterium]|nr:hypothetical protein [Candidatus Gracilibacteria bacterium]
MKNSPILQVLLIVFLVGAGIFLYIENKSTVRPEDTKIQSESERGTTDGVNSLYEAEQKKLQKKMDDYTIYNNAVDALDIGACEKIVGNDALKSECTDNVYTAQASKEKNVQICDKIQNTDTKTRCLSGFAYDTAIASGKQSDCDKITGDSDLKNACTKNVVFAQIESASFTGTVDVCASLTGVDKDYCMGRIKKDTDIDLLQKGTSILDMQVCLKIQDTKMKNTCSDTIYITQAMEKQDGTLCAKIVDPARKTTCTAKFVQIADKLALQQARASNNLAMCAKITTQALKTSCTDGILQKQGVANKDTAICAKISDASTKKDCTDAVKLLINQANK